MISNREELDQAMAAIVQIDANKKAILADLDEALNEVRDEFAGLLQIEVDGESMHVDQRRQQLFEMVQEYSTKNRKEMVPAGQKYVDTTHGRIGWKVGNASVEVLKQSKAKLAEGLLAVCVLTINTALGLWARMVGKVSAVSLLRIDVEWDKQAIMKASNDGLVTKAELKAEGLKINAGKESFYIKPKTETPDEVKP